MRGDIRLSESEQESNGFWADGHVPFDLPLHGCIEEVDGTRKCPEQSDGSRAITLQPVWIAEVRTQREATLAERAVWYPQGMKLRRLK